MSRLKVGIVGAGHVSAAHIRGWRKAPLCEVRAILDRDEAAAQARARQFDLPVIARDLEELVASSDIIDVCTPPSSHSQLAISVLEAGRHLVIEKPVVTSVEEWDQVRNALVGSGARLCVVHNIKFSRGVQKALRWVAAGRIGEVLRVRRTFLTHAQSDRMLTQEGHWSHTLPGGRWFETLPHALYLTHALAGPLRLDGVTALSTDTAPPGAPADEVAISLAGSGKVATVHYSANCVANRRRLLVEGTRGAIDVDVLGDCAVLLLGKEARWKRPFGSAIGEAVSTTLQWFPDRAGYLLDRLMGRTPHSRILVAFAQHLTQDAPHPTPIEEVEYVVRMSDAIGRAIDARIRSAR